uniref:RRM domain-containing protein n=1 Tax=Vannella robusta TaxID=1487602 RepID=A0A7S4IG52_9EUKA|mmetsp:Transcript_25372/g.32278  ORF Transcript_25372/g.32278 Transcript_25372/m.32278 type:complete len:222 (+) Transcript_25372:2-667(+)
MEVELDELIKQKKQQNRTQRGGNRRNRRDKDGDVNMGSSRGPGRKPQRQRKPRRDGPYSRSNYNTTGDTSQNWKHDLYNKDEDEIEETGWGSKRTKQEEDLLRGTTVLIDNIHYEVSEEELKNVFVEKVGSVRSAKIFYDKSGRSKGQGKVVFDKYSDAETAVGLSGEKLKGNEIKVTIQEVQPRRNTREPREKEISFTVTNRRRSPSPTRITFVNPRARR